MQTQNTNNDQNNLPNKERSEKDALLTVEQNSPANTLSPSTPIKTDDGEVSMLCADLQDEDQVGDFLSDASELKSLNKAVPSDKNSAAKTINNSGDIKADSADTPAVLCEKGHLLQNDADFSSAKPKEETAPKTQADTDDELPDIPISSQDLNDEISRKHTNSPKKRRKKLWSFLLFIAVNVIVISITAFFEFDGNSTTTIADVADSLSEKWYYLVFALLCFLCIYLFQALKINRMIKVMTGESRLRVTINSVIIGKYYDKITPLSIGGQPFQAYYLNKNKVPVGVATAAPIVQLFLGTCAFLTIGLVSFIFYSSHVNSGFVRICAYIGLAFYALTPTAILFFSLMPKVTVSIVSFFIKILSKLHIVRDREIATEKALHTIAEYRSSIQLMWKSKSTMIIGYLLSILEKLSEMSITYFVLMACLNGNFSYLQTTAMTIFIYAATSFVPTPGTAGASEGTFYIVFGSFWPMFIWRLFSYYSYLLFGFVLIIYNGIMRNIKQRRQRKTQGSPPKTNRH